MENFPCLPNLIAHADWGSNPNKRWLARAVLKEDGYYWVAAPEKVIEPAGLISGLQQASGPGGLTLVGFDFPIGLPQRYAERCGIHDFVSMLTQFGHDEWAAFYQVAEQPEQISLKRPFYPQRPGHARQSDLTGALGAVSIDELRRLCELPRPGRRAAAPLFWTLGGQQVGKAAICGWQEVLAPALCHSPHTIAIWPFAGSLHELCQTGKTVITETYPAEFYSHLGIVFSSPKAGQKSGKRTQADRAANAHILLGWAERAGLALAPQLCQSIESGFGSAQDGEDRFDATIGLFGMLNVVLGFHSPGDPTDEHLRKIEGWILGQDVRGQDVPGQDVNNQQNIV